MKRSLLYSFSCLAVLAFTPTAQAAILYESGTLGPTGILENEIGGGTAPGGAAVSDFVFNGVRFEITQPVATTRVGGHFVLAPGHDEFFFGAIVQLDGATDFPDSGDLSTPDVLGATVLTFPNPSAEVFGNLELQLNPGWYALVFGSGLFWATGQGSALLNNPDIGTPSYIGHQPGAGWLNYADTTGTIENFRMVVEGNVIPEPSSITLACLTFLLCAYSKGLLS